MPPKKGGEESMTTEREEAAQGTRAAGTGATPTIRWDDSNLKSSYANVCNVASTREEVVLMFGTNQAPHSSS